MMRKVIDYLRRKQNITIDDLVLEICSNNMYYKYISGMKNICNKKLSLIKERLGADEITKAEIDEIKNDLNKITFNIMRFYSSKEKFQKDMEPLIEIESQIILTEELIIPYLIAKINYLYVCSNKEEILSILDLLKSFESKMTTTEKLLYYYIRINIYSYNEISIENEVNDFIELLEKNLYNKDYGTFSLSTTLYYMRLRNRPGAFRMSEIAIELFQRDINIIGLVKAVNTKGILLASEGKHQEALPLFITNYDNCKKINAGYEMFICLSNIIESSLEVNNELQAEKYFTIFLKRINKIADKYLIRTILNNVSVGLLTTFDYYKKSESINALLSIIKKCGISENIEVLKLVEYFELKDMEEIVEYAVEELLPNIVGKAHFAYCRWLIDKCVLYYRNNRMYKKAVDVEIEYVKVFKEYYYF